MNKDELLKMFNLQGQVAVVTGGGGVICGDMSRTLAAAGAQVVVLDLNLNAAQMVVEDILAAGGQALALACNVLEKESIEQAAAVVRTTYGRVDILINGAGGNKPQATTSESLSFFDIPSAAFQFVFDLNLVSALLTSQVFGKFMAEQRSGVIINISSMNALRPLTRIPAYSAAKAGISNFTQWLAVHLAQEIDTHIRVNAIAPGFLVGEQNRALLYNPETNQLSARGEAIIAHTPVARFGETKDLMSTLLWLVSPASSFITGVVVPADGGFSAFSGV